MDREQIIGIVAKYRQILEQNFGVKHLYLFGSFARNEATVTSDVDMLVEFSRPTGLFGLAALQLFLEDKTGHKVDLGTAGSLKPYIRKEIEKDIILVA